MRMSMFEKQHKPVNDIMACLNVCIGRHNVFTVIAVDDVGVIVTSRGNAAVDGCGDQQIALMEAWQGSLDGCCGTVVELKR